MAIKTLESLRAHLQAAIELEHATIPAYLTAMYTIEPGTNSDAAAVMRSVVMEEMLHLTLAANVLNAVGGEPAVSYPRFVPEYPSHLPYNTGGVLVSLAKLSRENLDVFLQIERPAHDNGLMEVHGERYASIGDFYDAILHALDHLTKELGKDKVFSGDRARQVTPDLYYGGGGAVVEVHDLRSAHEALEQIIHQGEGLPRSIWDGDGVEFRQPREVAHYFRFLQIEAGRYFQAGDTPKSGPTGAPLPVQWDRVYDMKPNPKSADYPEGSELRIASDEFNRAYSRLLRGIHEALNGRPRLLVQGVGGMYELRERAVALIKNPYPGEEHLRAGPSFELVEVK